MFQPQHSVHLNPPFCAKCKKQIMQASIQQDPMRQVATLRYACHGVQGEMTFTQQELVELSSGNTLIDFVEFIRLG
jgi:hypothetical protein